MKKKKKKRRKKIEAEEKVKRLEEERNYDNIHNSVNFHEKKVSVVI